MTDLDLRHKLIATTVDLLRTVEPTELSLRHVARELGVSSGAPYHHFPDKPALLAAVAEQGWARLNEALGDATHAGAAPERLRAMGLAYLRFAIGHPSHYRVMFLPELKDPARFAPLHEASDLAFGGLVALVAAARGRPAQDAETVTRAVGSWATVHGLAVLANSGVLAGKTDQVPLDTLLAGVADAAVRAALSP